MISKWVVVYMHQWKCIEAGGAPVRSPIEGSEYFIPAFETREDAEAFSDRFLDGNGKIAELTTRWRDDSD